MLFCIITSPAFWLPPSILPLFAHGLSPTEKMVVDETPQDPAPVDFVTAAKLKMFGVLTRTEEVWTVGCSSLCCFVTVFFSLCFPSVSCYPSNSVGMQCRTGNRKDFCVSASMSQIRSPIPQHGSPKRPPRLRSAFFCWASSSRLCFSAEIAVFAMCSDLSLVFLDFDRQDTRRRCVPFKS